MRRWRGWRWGGWYARSASRPVLPVTLSAKRSAATRAATAPDTLAALRRWVRTLPVADQVVIKHSVILKTWLADGTEPELVIDSLDQHLAATRRRLDDALWSRQRTREVGLSEEPKLRYSIAVLNYSIRALYGELSNITQLRDEISAGTAQDPVARVNRPKGQLRRAGDVGD